MHYKPLYSINLGQEKFPFIIFFVKNETFIGTSLNFKMVTKSDKMLNEQTSQPPWNFKKSMKVYVI